VSKGGVLHHFPTKDALIGELVHSMTVTWEAAVEAKAAEDPQPVGRYVRAFLAALSEPALAIVGRGLLGAVALNPTLLDPLRESYRRCQKRIAADGLDMVTAYECVLVADALWYGAIFELPPPPADVLEKLQARLVEATRS
jgi:AcrR family transcriptional regulator